jgi:MFS superfamily sulfate permease-like transporter
LAALITFFACLLWNLAYGILVGVSVQLFFILYNIARPKVDIQEKKVVKNQCTRSCVMGNVKIYNTTNSLVRFTNRNILCFKKHCSLI